MTIKDLLDFELSNESSVQAWSNEELTYLSIRFVTLCIPNEQFKELLSGLTQYHRNTINSMEVS